MLTRVPPVLAQQSVQTSGKTAKSLRIFSRAYPSARLSWRSKVCKRAVRRRKAAGFSAALTRVPASLGAAKCANERYAPNRRGATCDARSTAANNRQTVRIKPEHCRAARDGDILRIDRVCRMPAAYRTPVGAPPRTPGSDEWCARFLGRKNWSSDRKNGHCSRNFCHCDRKSCQPSCLSGCPAGSFNGFSRTTRSVSRRPASKMGRA